MFLFGKYQMRDHQRNRNHASVDEILQGTIVSVWSSQARPGQARGQRIHWHGNLCPLYCILSTHPCVRVSSVALLTGTGVVPGRVVTKGVCSTSVRLSTLVNVWRIIIIYQAGRHIFTLWCWDVMIYDCWNQTPGGRSGLWWPHGTGEKAINFSPPDWAVAGLASLSNDILWLCDSPWLCCCSTKPCAVCRITRHCSALHGKKCLDWPKTTSFHTVFQRGAERSWDGIFRKISQMLFAAQFPQYVGTGTEASLGKLTWIFLPGYFFVWLEE